MSNLQVITVAVAAVMITYLCTVDTGSTSTTDTVVNQPNGCYSYRFMGTVAETECFPTAYEAAQKMYAMKAYIEYGMNMGLEKEG